MRQVKLLHVTQVTPEIEVRTTWVSWRCSMLVTEPRLEAVIISSDPRVIPWVFEGGDEEKAKALHSRAIRTARDRLKRRIELEKEWKRGRKLRTERQYVLRTRNNERKENEDA